MENFEKDYTQKALKKITPTQTRKLLNCFVLNQDKTHKS